MTGLSMELGRSEAEAGPRAREAEPRRFQRHTLEFKLRIRIPMFFPDDTPETGASRAGDGVGGYGAYLDIEDAIGQLQMDGGARPQLPAGFGDRAVHAHPSRIADPFGFATMGDDTRIPKERVQSCHRPAGSGKWDPGAPPGGYAGGTRRSSSPGRPRCAVRESTPPGKTGHR